MGMRRRLLANDAAQSLQCLGDGLIKQRHQQVLQDLPGDYQFVSHTRTYIRSGTQSHLLQKGFCEQTVAHHPCPPPPPPSHSYNFSPLQLNPAATLHGASPVSSSRAYCHPCCGSTRLLGTVTQATKASTPCMVPLYSMMTSVVSVLRSSLTHILADALNPACNNSEVKLLLPLLLLTLEQVLRALWCELFATSCRVCGVHEKR